MMVASVAIGWQIYEMERTPLALGLVGLCQFLPMFPFTLPAGEMSEPLPIRRKVLEIAAGWWLGLLQRPFLLLQHSSP